MNFLREWRGEGRKGKKRAADESSSQDGPRKRTKERNDDDDDDGGRCKETGTADATAADQELKIRGIATDIPTATSTPISTTTRVGFLHSPSPLIKQSTSLDTPQTKPSSPPIHPDRRANIFNASPTSASPPPSPPLSLQAQGHSSLSLLSPPSEQLDREDSEDHRCKYPHLI